MMKTLTQFYAEIVKKLGNSPRFLNSLSVFLILTMGLSVSFLLTFQLDHLPEHYSVGSVATTDIKADQNYEIVDAKSSQALRDEAEKSVLNVYDFDTTVEAGIVDHIHTAFESARLFLAENSLFDNQARVLPSDLENQMRREFDEHLSVNIDDVAYQSLRAFQFDPRIERTLQNLIKDILQSPVAFSLDDLKGAAEKGFVLRRLSKLEPFPEEIVRDTSSFKTLSEAVKALNVDGEERVMPYLNRMQTSAPAIVSIAANLLKVNLNFNSLETDIRRQRVSENIKNVIIKIKRGESVIRSGDRFDIRHLAVIEGMRQSRARSNTWFKFLGIFLFVNLVLLIVYYYSINYLKKFRPNRKDLLFLGLTLVAFLISLRLGVFFTSSIRDAIPFQMGSLTLYYILPVAAGAMLIRFVMNSETALIFSVVMSLFAGIYLENNLELAIYYLISGVFAAHAIAGVDKRSAVLQAGVLTGLVNVVTILSLNFISMNEPETQLVWNVFVADALAGFFGGIITSIAVLSLAPVAETLFNYTTNIKLLELANMSHPLLKQMIVKAPGTYHHSQIVGILSEGGAQAIGANALLARVASYYHDIGKMKKPQYYIENQRGENPHDKLVPTMSAIIIAAHVTDGIEMAREYKLPQSIADMIPQHQGTKLIGFFYNKAKKLAEINRTPVNAEDFRYIGPKPQTREGGIIMLADTIEAAVRSLSDKSLDKVRTTVEKLVNQHFVDQQLDECDLTLRDLHHIAEAFVKILTGIYHQRIEYPEGALNAEGRSTPEIPIKGHEDPYQQRASKHTNVTHLFRSKDQNPS